MQFTEKREPLNINKKETEPQIQIFSATEGQKVRLDKPNEDSYAFKTNETLTVVSLADGVTRPRNPDGSYPKEISTIASNTFTKVVSEELNEPTKKGVLEAIKTANEKIANENEKQEIKDPLDYLSATGCVLCIDSKTNKAVFAYVGDVIGIYIPKEGEPRLLTKDQLHNCHTFSKPYFDSQVSDSMSKEQAKAERLLWQKKNARNKPEAKDGMGNPIGYGIFNGEKEAMDLLEIQEFQINHGDKIILSSDALRSTAEIEEGKEEKISSYKLALKTIMESTPDQIPQKMITLTNDLESKKGISPDDKTIVVISL